MTQVLEIGKLYRFLDKGGQYSKQIYNYSVAKRKNYIPGDKKIGDLYNGDIVLVLDQHEYDNGTRGRINEVKILFRDLIGWVDISSTQKCWEPVDGNR